MAPLLVFVEDILDFMRKKKKVLSFIGKTNANPNGLSKTYFYRWKRLERVTFLNSLPLGLFLGFAIPFR